MFYMSEGAHVRASWVGGWLSVGVLQCQCRSLVVNVLHVSLVDVMFNKITRHAQVKVVGGLTPLKPYM
jgi:hypothetical protein